MKGKEGSLGNKKIIVIKIGTRTLTEQGQIRRTFLDDLARQVALLWQQDFRFIFIVSGAVSIGYRELGWWKDFDKEFSLNELQLQQHAAAVGQPIMMERIRSIFSLHGFHAAQVLFTWDEINNVSKGRNRRDLLLSFFSRHDMIIPFINEDDVNNTEELAQLPFVADNDRLATYTAILVGAQELHLMTNVEGYIEYPDGASLEEIQEKGKLVHLVSSPSDITKIVSTLSRRQKTGDEVMPNRKGGMLSKMQNGYEAHVRGITTRIYKGANPDESADQLIRQLTEKRLGEAKIGTILDAHRMTRK